MSWEIDVYQTIKTYAYALWMGIGLGILGVHLTEWKWWLFVIPMVVLVLWSKS